MRLTADQNGERLDAFLSRQGDNLSRSAAQKLIEAGAVRLNGKLPKKNDRLNLRTRLTLIRLALIRKP